MYGGCAVDAGRMMEAHAAITFELYPAWQGFSVAQELTAGYDLK